MSFIILAKNVDVRIVPFKVNYYVFMLILRIALAVGLAGAPFFSHTIWVNEACLPEDRSHDISQIWNLVVVDRNNYRSVFGR